MVLSIHCQGLYSSKQDTNNNKRDVIKRLKLIFECPFIDYIEIFKFNQNSDIFVSFPFIGENPAVTGFDYVRFEKLKRISYFKFVTHFELYKKLLLKYQLKHSIKIRRGYKER